MLVEPDRYVNRVPMLLHDLRGNQGQLAPSSCLPSSVLGAKPRFILTFTRSHFADAFNDFVEGAGLENQLGRSSSPMLARPVAVGLVRTAVSDGTG